MCHLPNCAKLMSFGDEYYRAVEHLILYSIYRSMKGYLHVITHQNNETPDSDGQSEETAEQMETWNHDQDTRRYRESPLT